MADAGTPFLVRPKATTPSRDDAAAAAAPSETTPLIESSPTPRYYDPVGPSLSAAERLSALARKRTATRRWPSIVAIVLLALACISILLAGFIIPDRVRQYAEKAIVIEPTSLSLESITDDGVRARIQANFRLESSRVPDAVTRCIGKLVTSVVRRLGTDSTVVSVYLPDFGDMPVGTAALPPLTVALVDGENTVVDVIAEFAPGNMELVRVVANKWLGGKLDVVRIRGRASISVRSGSISLGTHAVAETLVVEGKNIPAMPAYRISELNVTDVNDPTRKHQAIGAHVSVRACNPYPVAFSLPPLAFEILVPSCNEDDDRILVADGALDPVFVHPRSNVTVSGAGLVRELPAPLTEKCPNSVLSPLDHIMKRYLGGKDAALYVRGRGLAGTPKWLRELVSSVTVPVAFPGGSFDNVIGNVSFADVDFKLPDKTANPDDPESANPKISGTLEVEAGLPREVNFYVNVTAIRARADLIYGSRKLGELIINEWQPADSVRIGRANGTQSKLRIRSHIDNVPLRITDGELFSEVVGRILFGGETVLFNAKAAVDAEVETVLGRIPVKDIPAEGIFPVKPVPGGGVGVLRPRVGEVRILYTSPDKVEAEAVVNITNPTPYSADIPHINVHVYENGTIIGEVTAHNLSVVPGDNTNLKVRGKWEPLRLGGEPAEVVGRNLISQYLSGYNVSIVAKTHRDSVPRLPVFGDALSRFNFTVDAPPLDLPGDSPERRQRFIRDATFHLLSSTATFTLISPLAHDTIYIERIEAVALYNHTEPVGFISYDEPFPAPPGASRTPRLPVDWSLDSVGFQRLEEALGGHMKLDARANVTVRLGAFKETIWYEGRSIGAHVRL